MVKGVEESRGPPGMLFRHRPAQCSYTTQSHSHRAESSAVELNNIFLQQAQVAQLGNKSLAKLDNIISFSLLDYLPCAVLMENPASQQCSSTRQKICQSMGNLHNRQQLQHVQTDQQGAKLLNGLPHQQQLHSLYDLGIMALCQSFVKKLTTVSQLKKESHEKYF